MTNDRWGSKWPSGAGWFDKPKLEDAGIAIAKEQSGSTDHNIKWSSKSNDEADISWPEVPKLTGLDLGIGDRTVLTTFENDGIKHKIISQTELKSQGSNLVDDQQYLYFQCDGCNKILDPHTKSFAKLQEHRVNAGWHVKWNIDGMGYKVYCAKCGEKV